MTAIFLCLKRGGKHIVCQRDDKTRKISNFIKFQFTLGFFFSLSRCCCFTSYLWLEIYYKKKATFRSNFGIFVQVQEALCFLIYCQQRSVALPHSKICSNVERLGSSLSDNTLKSFDSLTPQTPVKPRTLRRIYPPPGRLEVEKMEKSPTGRCFSPTMCTAGDTDRFYAALSTVYRTRCEAVSKYKYEADTQRQSQWCGRQQDVLRTRRSCDGLCGKKRNVAFSAVSVDRTSAFQLSRDETRVRKSLASAALTEVEQKM